MKIPTAISAPEANHYADPLTMLEAELRAGLQQYWQIAATILQGSPVHLYPPAADTFSLQRNFFSALFLYSYYRVGIAGERRILYAAVNQCLRGMVTGCDNILDDEYKPTLETDLPARAHRFRSVLDIMVSDRILMELILNYCQVHALPLELVGKAGTTSLQALTRSGVQEASEEGGVGRRLPPREILEKIHHYKTGLLFQCTWAVPAVLETVLPPMAAVVQDALYRIGMGCQILDDMVDLLIDLREMRHNYVASVIYHQEPPTLWQDLQAMVEETGVTEPWTAEFPDLAARMKAEARCFLDGGLGDLFAADHQFFVQPAATFIAGRIGVTL
jgi:hypothetical protein